MAAPSLRPGEFALIRRYFAPLAAGNPAALDLTDDAALLTPAEGRQIVLTTDTVVAGVHFPEGEAAGDVAHRLLRVNLSDLAAMGGRPEGYLLNLALTPGTDEAWLSDFTAALAADQARYGTALMGGDTVAMAGPMTLTLTAVGSVPAGRALRRGGARIGDQVYVSGTIGDGVFGLWAIQGRLPAGIDPAPRQALADSFRRPEPRLALGQALAEQSIATAAIDVSDGLLADLGHICEASGVAAAVEAARVPMSRGGRAVVTADPALLAEALTGGDDYELLFTAPAEARDRIAALARELDLPLTPIGRIEVGAGVRAIGPDGSALPIGRAGFEHR